MTWISWYIVNNTMFTNGTSAKPMAKTICLWLNLSLGYSYKKCSPNSTHPMIGYVGCPPTKGLGQSPCNSNPNLCEFKIEIVFSSVLKLSGVNYKYCYPVCLHLHVNLIVSFLCQSSKHSCRIRQTKLKY